MEVSNALKRKRYNDDNYMEAEVDLSLLEAVEKSQNTVELLDLRTLKKLVLSFERRLKENIEARLKYPDQPERFADSEVELHEELEKLKILAGAPELYPELVNLNAIPSILNLLSHDNTDIAIDVVHLLEDLTDEDVLEDNDEPARILVDSLIENNVLELLVQNLQRLSDKDPDEMSAIYNTLASIENMIEVKPTVAELVCERTKLLRWLLGKIKVREFDSNKQYASEILAILLQNSTANQKRLGQMNGVDVKKSAYASAIRALDFSMTKYPPACERFVDVLGLKTAFAAFMGKASISLFIPISKKNKKERYQEELEERLVSLIASLFGGILRGSRRERLLSKFVENECEKIDRLMELYIRYSDRVTAETQRLEQLELDDLEMDEEEKYFEDRTTVEHSCCGDVWGEQRSVRGKGGVLAEKKKKKREKYKFLERSYILRVSKYNEFMVLESALKKKPGWLIAVILGHLWCSEHPQMRARIELLLKQQKLTKNDIKNILQCFIGLEKILCLVGSEGKSFGFEEYHDNIGDLDGAEEKERVQTRIQKIISSF
ncbi:hypothetical protein GOBAR_DD05762 [Gossypium barbadense]|nr:hypothetical protein GOBAR_DD05762 [Gossypium barbadense]